MPVDKLKNLLNYSATHAMLHPTLAISLEGCMQTKRVESPLFLREWRERYGATQEVFAALLGVPRSTLSCWEIHISRPPLPMLLRIVAVLGITVEQLCHPPPVLEPVEEPR